MIHIQAHWLALVIFAGALLWVGYLLWKSGRPLTVKSALAAGRIAWAEAQAGYEIIKLGIMSAQERKRTGKITNGEEAKAYVTHYVLKRFPETDRKELSETIDGLYWMINQFGDKLPDIELEGESFLEKLRQKQFPNPSTSIPSDIDQLSATLPDTPNLG